MSIYYTVFLAKKFFLKAPIIHNCKNLAAKGNNSLRKYAIQKLSIHEKKLDQGYNLKEKQAIAAYIISHRFPMQSHEMGPLSLMLLI